MSSPGGFEPAQWSSADCHEQHCVTCGDDATPMVVEGLDAERGLALCAAEDGGRHTVEIALIDPVCIGDSLLVHAGVALAVRP